MLISSLLLSLNIICYIRWKGYVPLSRSIDPKSGYKAGTDSSPPEGRVTRVLLQLSRGGADATHLREFDLLTESFVEADGDDMGFTLPEGKTRARYKTRDVLLVGADTGEGSMTTSGYPRTAREWKRGTKIEDAPIVFEGEETDVSCGQYIYDEKHRDGGDMYEVQSRSMDFYNSMYFMKKEGSSDEFVKLAIATNTEPSFFGRWLLLHVKADWEPKDSGSLGKVYKSGSLIYVDAQSFLEFSKAKGSGNEEAIEEAKAKLEYHILFEPTEKSSYAGYSTTKNYLILYSLDDVKEKLTFFKLGANGGEFVLEGGDEEGTIQDSSASGVDAKDSDLIWYSTSSYTQPSTLNLADASKYGKDDFLIKESLKALPHMVRMLFSVLMCNKIFSSYQIHSLCYIPSCIV